MKKYKQIMFTIESINKLFQKYFKINSQFSVDTSITDCFTQRGNEYVFKYDRINYFIFLQLLSRFNVEQDKLTKLFDYFKSDIETIYSDYEEINKTNL